MSSPQLVLYGMEISPPVRTVMLTLKALNLNYEFKEINVMPGEPRQAEFLKKNPQHTVPTLEDGALVLSDSHAICAYLVRKYGNNDVNDDDSLYPKDFNRRAIVDQRLHYETGILYYTCMKQISRLLFNENATEIPKDKIEQIHEAYSMLETFLGENAYMTGSALTIADFSIVSTVSSFDAAFVAVSASKYPKLSTWLGRMAALPYYGEVNGKGVRAFTECVKSKLPKQFDKLWQKAMADIKSGKK